VTASEAQRGAAHRAIDAVWRIESARLIAGLARMVRDVGLAEELAQDALVVVDVLTEEVERGDALGEAGFDHFPFVGGDDARDEIEGEYFFGLIGVAARDSGLK
jgi:voltage-gated potassium channel Kch